MFAYRGTCYAASARGLAAVSTDPIVYLASPGRLQALQELLPTTDRNLFEYPVSGYLNLLQVLQLPPSGYDFSFLTSMPPRIVSHVNFEIRARSPQGALGWIAEQRRRPERHAMVELWRQKLLGAPMSAMVGADSGISSTEGLSSYARMAYAKALDWWCDWSRELRMQDNSLLISAIPSLLAGTLGFTGVVVGARFTARGQHRQWLRQERLKVYSQYLELAQQALRIFSVDAAFSAVNSISSSTNLPSNLREIWIQADGVLAQISILGQRETLDRGRQLALALTGLLEAQNTPLGADAIKREEVAEKVQRHINDFRTSASKEIGVQH
jgi:hypothetical protein